MNNYEEELKQINDVYEQLIKTTNDSVASKLYKKCVETFEKFKDDRNINSHKELRKVSDNIVTFREYLNEYHNVKQNTDSKQKIMIPLQN